MSTKMGYSICSICDIGCQVRTEATGGKVTRVIAHDNPLLAKNICFKGVAAPSIHNADDRLRVPLKRIGERVITAGKKYPTNRQWTKLRRS